MEYYSNTYLGARKKFRNLVKKTKGHLYKIKLDDTFGADGEQLYIDLAHYGSYEPERLIIHSVGINGIDGYVGSAIQCNIIDNFLPECIPDECAILFIHIVNPYGMSHSRICNKNNVCLNNNFVQNESTINKHCPSQYEDLHNFFNPISEPIWWKGSYLVNLINKIIFEDFTYDDLLKLMGKGQNSYAKGLFYMGQENQQEIAKLTSWINQKYSDTIDTFHINVQLNASNDPIMYQSHCRPNIHYDIRPDSNIGTIRSGLSNYCFEGANNKDICQIFNIDHDNNLLMGMIKENYYTHHKKININHKSRRKLLKYYRTMNEDHLAKSSDLFVAAIQYLF